MNVINRATIRRAQRKHPECREWLDIWWQTARAAEWRSLADVRRLYPTTNQVGGCLVFDAPHARRLIVGVRFARRIGGGTVYVKHFLTHQEYDRGAWKLDCRKKP
jgi:mRNA interferase HigB